MEKIIKIGDKEVKLSNNVAWTMEYRDQFNKDVLEAMMPLVTALIETVTTIVNESGSASMSVEGISEALQGRAFEVTLPLMQLGLTDSVINVVWAMAKAADPSINPPKAWVRQFDSFPLDEIVPAVGELIISGFASSKNLERLRSLANSLRQNQPLTSTLSSSQESKED